MPQGMRPPGAAGAMGGAPRVGAAARRVRLSIARVDPWSVLKLAFLLSVAIGIATVIASIVVWNVLDGMGVFSSLNKVSGEIAGPGEKMDIYDFVGLGRIMSISIVIAVINVLLLTALATLGAFLYNLASGLVGGLQVTLSDD
ncbi:MAG: DUF3566 domain-containing protein [Actinomycetales bacterium]|nr:DUF3566 domain-containing protein [Actinomycetales bacterium]